MPKRSILLSIALFCLFRVNAQQDVDFTRISLREGLSQSSVTDIAQDSKGFLWFATIDGLNRYNGYEIVIYYNEDKAGALPGNIINTLHSLETPESQQLWIGTENNGLCRYNSLKNNFLSYNTGMSEKQQSIQALAGTYPFVWVGSKAGLIRFDVRNNKWFSGSKAQNEVTSKPVTAIAPTDDGHLWIGTRSGLYYADTTNLTPVYGKVPKEFRDAHITSLAAVNSFEVWVGTEAGLWLLSTESGILKAFQTGNSPLTDNHITQLCLDYKGELWATTRAGGLFRYFPKQDTATIYTHDASDKQSLSSDNLLSVFQDDDHNLWVGASLGGVNKWVRAANDFEVYRHNPYLSSTLSADRVRSIYEDSKGTVWIGTVDGGLNRWEGENQFTHFKHEKNNPQSLSYNHVRAINEDHKGNLWIGTDGGGINRLNRETGTFTRFMHQREDNTSLSHNRVWCTFEDNQENLWVGTYGGGLNLMDRRTGTFQTFSHKPNDPFSLSSDFVITIYEDNFGKLWIGTADGLNFFQRETGRFFHYRHNPNDSTSISHNRIYSILEDREGNLWIGTKDGLNRFIRNTERFVHYSSQNYNFPNNVMMGILEDAVNNLWISTNRGLSRFNKNTGEIRNFDIRDNLQSNEFLVGAYHKTTDGKMLFGGINGFNAFYPEKIKNNPNIPEVALTGFEISNRYAQLDTAIEEKQLIRLKHNQNDLTFHFVALDYVYPEKNKYSYRLKGYDEDWVHAGYTRKARYTNLSPGRYIFQVRGSNNDGIWNKTGRNIVVAIRPAFWQTSWFRIGGALFVLLLAALIIYLRFRMMHKQKRLLEKRVKERTAEVIKQRDEIQQKNQELSNKQEEIITQNEILQQQKEEIEAQRDDLEKQKELVSRQNKEITSSIEYAKKIQTAALPQEGLMNRLLPEHFVFFKARDIVSGDFFWAAESDGRIIAVAADCTGHGVPGAFMSMLGISLLNEVVNIQGIISPDEVLNALRQHVISALHQTGDFDSSRDGMDMTVCTIDRQKMEIETAGANNPLYLVRDQQITEYPSDPMPIAVHDLMEPFNKHTFSFQKGDMIYMFSDGYADQFGGIKGKKFKYKRFRRLISTVADKDVTEQYHIIDHTMQEWMAHPSPFTNNGFEQVDDMVIFGIRL